MSNRYTKDEARKILLEHIHSMVDYWSTLHGESVESKLNGLVFSILNIFDGSSVVLPPMDVVLRPHPEDSMNRVENGENYFEDGMIINDDVMLHEFWHKKKRDDR